MAAPTRRVVVYHRLYGCMTGCCGHAIAIDPESDEKYHDYSDREVLGTFDFAHPYDDDLREWAKDFVRRNMDPEHAADLDWDNCWVLDYENCSNS